MSSPPLVSVVVPAYNAVSTLDETLRSVRSQSHRELEIIVVDDGSTDETRAIAEQHASVDRRVQVVTQKNAGVAAARNHGWQRARSDLIAFVDADDVWAPTKIERQLQVLQAAGPGVGLVYCWYLQIDANSSVILTPKGPRWEGDVLQRLFIGNFVGNGSAALVRRQALIDAGGFDSRLRAARAEGCEDLLFYCRVAERYRFGLVPEHLVGYRLLPQSMSSNRTRMVRSWLMVADEMRRRHPEHADTLDSGLRYYVTWLIETGLASGARRRVLPLPFLLLARGRVRVAKRVVVDDLLRPWASRLRRGARRGANATTAGTVPGAGSRFPIGHVEH